VIDCDATKLRVLEAAVELLGTEGLRALTHARVDEQAGLPKGSASNYFRTRAQLVTGVSDWITERELAGTGDMLTVPPLGGRPGGDPGGRNRLPDRPEPYDDCRPTDPVHGGQPQRRHPIRRLPTRNVMERSVVPPWPASAPATPSPLPSP
jgi:AcrR family transcriptional regulator